VTQTFDTISELLRRASERTPEPHAAPVLLAGVATVSIGIERTSTPPLAAMPAVSGAGAGGGMMQPISIKTVVVENPANGQEVVAEILRAVKRTKAGMA
jgi:hypothetical protein